MTTANAMGELCMLMLQRALSPERFEHWVLKYYGDPGQRDSLSLVRWVARHHTKPTVLDRLRVHEFDMFLMRPEVVDCAFTNALIELRNVFARNANMAAPVTVTLDPVEVGPPRISPVMSKPAAAAGSVAEVLAQLLCAQSRAEPDDSGLVLAAST
jgi:hypothetical protein